ncbi:MAG: glycerol-3-phosphate 1-O-acyltransferase PlsY [Lachnospiraceae bacterium]|nr:glycerol-3-phosphate 1-O-acyltransferase PlsY [Lachnospiraceae bacterium]
MLVKIGVCLLIGYLLGCISFGYIVGKINHIDIREKGSGNVGATNTLRSLGWKAGLITFLGDGLKAIIPLFVMRFAFADLAPDWRLYALYLGLGVVLGHNFPFWMGFRGGKGISATAGVILALSDPRLTLTALVLFIIVVATTRYVSVGSLLVVLFLPLNVFLFWKDSPYFIHMMIVACVFTALGYIRHIPNIKRLLSGTENKLGQKKEK